MTKVELIAAIKDWPDQAQVNIAVFYPNYASIEDVAHVVGNGGGKQIGVIASKEVVERLIAEAPKHEGGL